jgi:hypothetical protein
MDEKEPTQEVQPEQGKPVTTPVPTRAGPDAAIAKVAPPPSTKTKPRHRKVTEAEGAAARQRARQRSGEDG